MSDIRYHNMSEEKKKKTKRISKNYHKAKKQMQTCEKTHFKTAIAKMFVLLLIFKR